MTGRHRRNPDPFQWHLDQFVAAPAGWRIVCLDELGTLRNYPLPGWLIQEVVVAYDSNGCPEPEDFQPPSPIRRAIAATIVSGELVGVYDGVADFWRIAAPYDLQPTPQEIRTELERRKKIERAAQLAK